MVVLLPIEELNNPNINRSVCPVHLFILPLSLSLYLPELSFLKNLGSGTTSQTLPQRALGSIISLALVTYK